jgi:hypothetical protein
MDRFRRIPADHGWIVIRQELPPQQPFLFLVAGRKAVNPASALVADVANR